MDLFAGCGGLTRGFVDSRRFESVLAVEVNRDAASTYRANFRRHSLLVSRIEDVIEFPAADVVVGGPPCQPFSPLNRSGAGLERRSLWREYLRALRASGANGFVMENVPQLLKSKEYESFRRAVVRLGFTVEAGVLNAADYGVPQSRRRAIVIGTRVGVPVRPIATHCNRAEPELQPWRTFREAVAGLSIRPNGVNWHRGRKPRPESILRYRAVPKDGGNRFQMQQNLESQGLSDLVLPCFKRKPTGTAVRPIGFSSTLARTPRTAPQLPPTSPASLRERTGGWLVGDFSSAR